MSAVLPGAVVRRSTERGAAATLLPWGARGLPQALPRPLRSRAGRTAASGACPAFGGRRSPAWRACRFRHPLVGGLTVRYETLVPHGDGRTTLFLCTAQPRSASAQALSLPASWTLAGPSAAGPYGEARPRRRPVSWRSRSTSRRRAWWSSPNRKRVARVRGTARGAGPSGTPATRQDGTAVAVEARRCRGMSSDGGSPGHASVRRARDVTVSTDSTRASTFLVHDVGACTTSGRPRVPRCRSRRPEPGRGHRLPRTWPG